MLFDLGTFIVSVFGIYSYYYGDSRYTLFAMFATILIFTIRNIMAGGGNSSVTIWMAVFVGLSASFFSKSSWYMGIAIAVCWEEAIMSFIEGVSTLFMTRKKPY